MAARSVQYSTATQSLESCQGGSDAGADFPWGVRGAEKPVSIVARP